MVAESVELINWQYSKPCTASLFCSFIIAIELQLVLKQPVGFLYILYNLNNQVIYQC